MKPLLLVLACAGSLQAQQPERPPLLLIPHGDSVLIYLTDAPPRFGGFVVYRSAPGETLHKVTAQPVLAVSDPARAAGILGADYPDVQRAMGTVDEVGTFRLLARDPFAGALLSLRYRNVAVVLGRFYADTALTPGARYDYRVQLTGAGGREQGRAYTGSVVVADVPPEAPTGLESTVDDHRATISWHYPKYRGDPADYVIGFHVYRADAPAAPFRLLTGTPVLRNDAAPFVYHDDDVENGVAYRYQVTAVAIAGLESAPSAPLSVTPADHTPPGLPVDVTTQPGKGMVLVVWRMSPEPDVAGYYVERSTSLKGPFTRLTSSLLRVSEPRYVDSAAVGGQQYFYRVIAVDRSGNASEPSNAIFAVPKDRGPPGPVDSVTVQVVAHRLRIAWKASPTAGVLGYFVYRTEERGRSASNPARLLSRPLPDTVFVDSGFGGKGLTPGGRYRISVTAVAPSFTESAPAVADVLVPDDEPPSPPTGVIVRDAEGSYATLAWSSSSALDVEAYVLTRTSGDSAPVTLGRYAARGPWLVRDTAVRHGATYVYRLIAVDSAGNRSAPVVDTLRFLRFTPPPRPLLAAARLTPQGVQVSWQRVMDPELAGYRVYRSASPTGVYAAITSETVRDLTLLDATGHATDFYVVRAVDTSGNESAPSPWVGVSR